MSSESRQLYGADHGRQSLAEVQRFFAQRRPPAVQAVYAMGSVVTGDYFVGYSDLDIIILAAERDLSDLMAELRDLSARLWITRFHILKPLDFPPPDGLFALRLRAESQLLYGADLVRDLAPPPLAELRRQLLLTVSHQLVNMRVFCCSAQVERQSPDTLLYQAQKLMLLGLRALFVATGGSDTRRAQVVAWAQATPLLSSASRNFAAALFEQMQRSEHPQTLAARLEALEQTIGVLEEVQRGIANMTA